MNVSLCGCTTVIPIQPCQISCLTVSLFIHSFSRLLCLHAMKDDDEFIDNDAQHCKRCRKCGEIKHVSQFSREAKREDGLQQRCKLCVSTTSKSRRSTVDGALRLLWHNAEKTSNWRGQQGRDSSAVFSLTMADLHHIYEHQNGRCYYFPGKIMSLVAGAAWHISIERLNPNGGYDKNNVVLCCQEFNNRVQWSPERIAEVKSLLVDQCDHPFDTAAFRAGCKYTKKKPSPRCTRPDHVAKAGRQCKICKSVQKKQWSNTPRGFLTNLSDRTEGNFTLQDLVNLIVHQAGRCKISGLLLSFVPGNPWQCSLERVNPRLGYTPENVIAICHAFQTTTNTIAHRGIADEDMIGRGAQWTCEKFNAFKDYIMSKEYIIHRIATVEAELEQLDKQLNGFQKRDTHSL